MNPFWAIRVHGPANASYSKLQQMNVNELTPGNVTIEVHYSGINYKDALAVTGKGLILKQFPLNAGIDSAGTVLESKDPNFKPGDKVIVQGAGSGENYDGGFAEIIRVQGEHIVPLPNGLTLKEAMILGTAGFTAALARVRMEINGQDPRHGPILITGASGGVGSFAVQLFAQGGYEVHAVSGKHEAIKYLKMLGAKEVLSPEQLELGSRPLEKARFGGAVDNVGGKMLSQLLAHIQLWGNVASIGLAESHELHTTVMPFILRGVSILGASSNNAPMSIRQGIWRKLGAEWKPKHLDSIVSRTVGLKDVVLAAEDLLHRKVQGRILVEIRKDT
jgi:acrylyl-CoA reductase (NADPH)